MPRAQQFVCMKCGKLDEVFCRCPDCGAKNQVAHTGAQPSEPGLLTVKKLLD
jgi:predicted ATP-dependent serine protease